jgi:hypothetical protein
MERENVSNFFFFFFFFFFFKGKRKEKKKKKNNKYNNKIKIFNKCYMICCNWCIIIVLTVNVMLVQSYQTMSIM